MTLNISAQLLLVVYLVTSAISVVLLLQVLRDWKQACRDRAPVGLLTANHAVFRGLTGHHFSSKSYPCRLAPMRNPRRREQLLALVWCLTPGLGLWVTMLTLLGALDDMLLMRGFVES